MAGSPGKISLTTLAINSYCQQSKLYQIYSSVEDSGSTSIFAITHTRMKLMIACLIAHNLFYLAYLLLKLLFWKWNYIQSYFHYSSCYFPDSESSSTILELYWWMAGFYVMLSGLHHSSSTLCFFNSMLSVIHSTSPQAYPKRTKWAINNNFSFASLETGRSYYKKLRVCSDMDYL